MIWFWLGLLVVLAFVGVGWVRYTEFLLYRIWGRGWWFGFPLYFVLSLVPMLLAVGWIGGAVKGLL